MGKRRARPWVEHLRSLRHFQPLYGVESARESIHDQPVALILVGPNRHYVIVLEVMAGEGLTAYRARLPRIDAPLKSV